MPGSNQKGPLGEGPLKGRGMGLCAENKTTGALGRGMGAGRGRRLGLGLGRGRGSAFVVTELDKDQETAMLRQEAQNMERELESIKKKL